MNQTITSWYQPLATPLLPFFQYETTQAPSNLYLKAENLQPFGSYKIRGIAHIFKTVDQDILQRGVRAASAGNMGQSLAYMAKGANIPCTIYVPETTPDVKKNRIRGLGAELIELPFTELWQYVTAPPLDRAQGLFVHPIFTPELIAGYQPLADELIQQLPMMDALVIPLGIGGMSIALCQRLQALKPEVDIFTCEPETAAPMHAALQQGGPVKVQRRDSFIDAIGTPEILPEVYAQLASVLKGSVVVSIGQTKKALRHLLTHNKLLCEGAAGCSVAAGQQLSEQQDYKAIVCLLTGGNLDSQYWSIF